MTNFLQQGLCLETESFSICSGMLMDITLEIWEHLFRCSVGKCPHWTIPSTVPLCSI